jgi:pimeloyl-ACP methyl ester carboxylesterase
MKLHGIRSGKSEKQKIIFLHGMGGTGSIWRAVTALLEDQFDCICPDQRGHGQSRPVAASDGQFTAIDYARDLAEYIDFLQIDRVLLVGHSMGVRTALATIEQIPDRISGLIAVDLGISEQWGGGVGFPLAEFLKNLPKSFSGRVKMKEYLAQHCPDPSIAQYLSAVAKQDAPQPESPENESWVFPFDHDAVVATIESAHRAPIKSWVQHALDQKIPLLFLHGQNSKVWSKADYAEQKAIWSPRGVMFESWENTSHGLPFEARVAFAKKVAEFANRYK